MKSNICIVKSENYFYPKANAFRPQQNYPEYPFKGYLSDSNHVYDMVREGFHLLGYDNEHWNTGCWNPLAKFISPGDTVVLKPNMVMDFNPVEKGTDSLITNPSVVAAVIDYVVLALRGTGKIFIGDAPMQECNFEKLIQENGYSDLIAFYKKNLPNTIEIELVDFRQIRSKAFNGIYCSEKTDQEGVLVRLDELSEFSQKDNVNFEKLRITNYDPEILKRHHNEHVHEYLVNKYILDADVIINLPKPKTHRKAGVTIALKNMVGINARKEYLPHHTNGSKEEGGDCYLKKSFWNKYRNEFLDKKNACMQTKKKYRTAWFYLKCAAVCARLNNIINSDSYFEGSWYGNDTISRSIVDLNKILFYADKKGNLHAEKQRKYLIIADMIISGEQEGPIEPVSKNVGIIAMGENPVCFDEAISKLMGAKYEYISTLHRARNPYGNLKLVGDEYPYLISNDTRWNQKSLNQVKASDLLYFEPTSGWKDAFNKNLFSTI